MKKFALLLAIGLVLTLAVLNEYPFTDRVLARRQRGYR